MHERTLAAIARGEDPIELVCPAPGLFRCTLALGDVVRGGVVIGELEMLGHLVRLVAPDAARGAVTALADRSSARPPVDFGAMLVTLDPNATAAGARGTPSSTASTEAAGLVFRAPTSGRFYGRAAPDKPAFVSVGDELGPGATVCLLEVMKTFHRVSYAGNRVRVRALLVKDGDDVNAGDPLLALDAI
ncbi:MAG TPA: biotin/lipoyl-containing protein [Kofleriaceae bacterium]|nr:biotin/lipoyl-containing protein [Kofleriaceae bacterium]